MNRKKKVLYLSNIEVPYRVRFFNMLAEECDLTLLYEREKSKNRDAAWTAGEKGRYKTLFLGGAETGNENGFSLSVLKYVAQNWDAVIVGCYNSPVQMLAMLFMRLIKKPFLINLDGEVFFTGNKIKSRLKKFFLKGGAGYLVAGEKAAENLGAVFPDKKIYPYYFSSLSQAETEQNAQQSAVSRNNKLLVVGQYFDYKGMDVALKAAALDRNINYTFVGMGGRTDLFTQENSHLLGDNIEIIPFLQKEQLYEQYRKCAALVLPSRQECWGLVINEAASFGTPIVSIWGSGAAVEFLSDKYPQLLAESGDENSLYSCIKQLENTDTEKYSQYLMEKSQKYTLEESVKIHIQAIKGLQEKK